MNCLIFVHSSSLFFLHLVKVRLLQFGGFAPKPPAKGVTPFANPNDFFKLCLKKWHIWHAIPVLKNHNYGMIFDFRH